MLHWVLTHPQEDYDRRKQRYLWLLKVPVLASPTNIVYSLQCVYYTVLYFILYLKVVSILYL